VVAHSEQQESHDDHRCPGATEHHAHGRHGQQGKKRQPMPNREERVHDRPTSGEYQHGTERRRFEVRQEYQRNEGSQLRNGDSSGRLRGSSH
jgi:hypothetical protein